MKSFFADLAADRMRLLTITTTIKYICSAMLVLLAVGSSGESGGLVPAYAELSAIFCVSNMILKKWNKQGHIVNGVLLLLFNAQMLVLLFGGTFISQAMITNLDSLEDLGEKRLYMGPVLRLFSSYLWCRHGMLN